MGKQVDKAVTYITMPRTPVCAGWKMGGEEGSRRGIGEIVLEGKWNDIDTCREMRWEVLRFGYIERGRREESRYVDT